MKRLLLSAVIAATPLFGYGQIFQEDWDGNGPGIAAWTVIDGDGLKVAEALSSMFPKAWSVLSPSDFYDLKNNVAGSTSWYTPKGQSNDWLISPSFKVTGTTPTLVWHAKAFEYTIPDGYKVMLSPSGGNAMEDFTVELFSIAAERTIWIERHVDLSAYDGKSIRIAFVNNSKDKFILGIDNILVTNNYTLPAVPKCPKNLFPTDGTKGIDFSAPPVFTWDAATSDDLGYKFTLNGDVLGYVNGSAAYLDGFLSGNMSYNWVINALGLGGESPDCKALNFTTIDGPTAPYCGPVVFNYFTKPITLVNFAGINNVTDPVVGGSGHEVFTDQTAQVQIGKTYTMTVEGNTNGLLTNYFAAFIDWNQNGIFEESETYILPSIYNSTGTDGKNTTINITVPDGAKEGITRLRVKKIGDTDVNLSDPCKGANYGQVEDYNVKVSKDLAVSDIQKFGLNVYPNPVKDLLNIDTKLSIKSLSIYGINGEFIFSPKLDSNNQVNLSKLSPGAYIIKVLTTDNKTISEKIVKK